LKGGLEPEMEIKNWLLTGRPGVGKTTLIRLLLSSLRVRAGGFLTEEIREQGERVGFRLRDLEGKEGILAHVSFPGPCRVGRYGVRVETMEEIGVPALRRAVAERELVIVDEIGRMELFCPPFREEIQRALDAATPLLGVVQQRSLYLFPDLPYRPDTRIWEVSPSNRDWLGPELRRSLLAAYPHWAGAGGGKEG
jgi:nucleoside-triphosphatase